MRVPVVAGVAGGVGTTTIAAALRGYDAGRLVDARVDVLVCRCTGDSLRRAARLADQLAGPAPRPVLAVTAEARMRSHGCMRARLRMLEPQFCAVTVLPHVGRWRELSDPLAEASELIARRGGELPRALRGYGAALRRLVAEVAATGRLHQQPTRQPDVRARFAPPAAPEHPLRGIRLGTPHPATNGTYR